MIPIREPDLGQLPDLAYPCAPGATTKDGEAEQALGHTEGQIQPQNPQGRATCCFFFLMSDQWHDITQLEGLMADQEFERLIADRAYDLHWYKKHHLVECFINRIKHFQRIFFRFDKLTERYPGFLIDIHKNRLR